MLVETFYSQLYSNDMLIGQNFSPIPLFEKLPGDTSFLYLNKHQEYLYQTLWSCWCNEVLPSLCTPRSKWSERCANIRIRNIGLLLSHSGSGGMMLTYYKYCKVFQIIRGRMVWKDINQQNIIYLYLRISRLV